MKNLMNPNKLFFKKVEEATNSNVFDVVMGVSVVNDKVHFLVKDFNRHASVTVVMDIADIDLYFDDESDGGVVFLQKDIVISSETKDKPVYDCVRESTTRYLSEVKPDQDSEQTKFEKLKGYIDYLMEDIHDHYFAENETCLERIVDIVLRHEAHTQHVGFQHQRCKTNPREKAFFEQWMHENYPNHGVNFGHGILQDLFFEESGFSAVCKEVINERDRMIVATVIQWLGSNCGMAFLSETFDKFGYKMLQKEK